MKKSIMVCLTALVLVFVLTACGKKSDDVTVDITKLAADLQESIDSSVAEISSDIFASTFFVDMDKIEESTALLNSGAYAGEIVIVKCKNSDYVSEVETLFQTRAQNQSKLFADYNAPEAAKLDAALIRSAGNYVVYCVPDDTAKAEEILKAAGF